MFQEVDSDNNGIINEEQFRELLSMMNCIQNEDEVTYLLQLIDPYNNQQLTFSEVVHLFSSVSIFSRLMYYSIWSQSVMMNLIRVFHYWRSLLMTKWRIKMRRRMMMMMETILSNKRKMKMRLMMREELNWKEKSIDLIIINLIIMLVLVLHKLLFAAFESFTIY